MFEGRSTFTSFGLDINRYTKTLDKAMEVQLRQAARAWLRAIVKNGVIPVWTGTSKGVFLPLGRYLRRVAIPIKPVKQRKGFGPEVGAAKSAFDFRKEGNKHIFEFLHDLGYFTNNEEKKMKPPINLRQPGPYRAFVKGEAAFNKYLDENLDRRLPSPAEVTRSREYIT
jgi:hypothetical protein